MKKNLLLILTLAFLSTHAFAVTVANCPQRGTLTLTGIRTVSASWLGSHSTDARQEPMRQLLDEAGALEFKMELTESSTGRCRYNVASTLGNRAEIIIATTRGRDWLKVAAQTSGGILSGLFSLAEYSQTSLTAADLASLGVQNNSNPDTFSEPILAKAVVQFTAN